MKNLIKLLAVSLILLSIVFSANAQNSKLEDKAQKETNDLVAALELDDDMSTKIYDVKLKHATERKEINKAYKKSKKAGEAVNEEDKKANLKVSRKAENEAIKAIIGKDNFKAFADYKRELRAAKKKG